LRFAARGRRASGAGGWCQSCCYFAPGSATWRPETACRSRSSETCAHYSVIRLGMSEEVLSVTMSRAARHGRRPP